MAQRPLSDRLTALLSCVSLLQVVAAQSGAHVSAVRVERAVSVHPSLDTRFPADDTRTSLTHTPHIGGKDSASKEQ